MDTNKLKRKTLGELDDSFRLGMFLIDHPEIIKKLPDNIYIPAGVKIGKILSPKRLELLAMINENQGVNVTGLAKKLKRKKEAVSRDLSILEKHNLVITEKKGKEKEVKTRIKYVIVPIST